MRFLAIDPSIRRIGWALFDTDAGEYNVLRNWNFGAACPPRQGRAEVMAFIKAHFSTACADHLICEMPAFFDTEKGRIAAREGHTNNLAMVIGTIYGVIPNVQLFLYTPQQWKGSIPKDVTLIRFKRTFEDNGNYNLVHDVVDAIMLLRYHMYQLTRC
jgi:hypothetical protein